MTERYRSETRFRHPNVVLNADASIVPCATGNETLPVTLAVFPDHGTPAFIGSTIQSRKCLVETARKLSEAESQRLNSAMATTIEGILSNKVIISQGIFRSTIPGKPNIHVIVDGDPFKESSLRLYFHIGQHEGATVLFQDARATKKDAGRIERAFVAEGGYNPPKNWQGNRGRD